MDSASKSKNPHGVAALARLSDEELLAVHRAEPASTLGREAISLLLARYHGRVYAWCRRLTGDTEEAFDIAQEVLLSAYRNLARFEGRARFGSWLFAIARNRCLGELRRPALLRDEETDPDEIVVGRPDPEQELLDRLDEERLLALIRARLGPQEQEALWLRCFERMPVDAITRILGVESASGARGLLQQARRKLRAALRDEEGAGQIDGSSSAARSER